MATTFEENQAQAMALAGWEDSRRNTAWEDQFLQALTSAKVNLLSEDPQTGPDGWPYLMVELTENSEEPVQRVLAWLATRGIGLVVNPQKDYPDYVLTYGMIWNFRRTGRFIDRRFKAVTGRTELAPGMDITLSEPPEDYLPSEVRKILREFLRDQGILLPRVALLRSTEQTDLVFSLESLRNPPEGEHGVFAEALGWFLPPHYSLMFLSEKDVAGFTDL